MFSWKEARYQPRRCTASMMVILWVVQTSIEFLVDRSIHMPFTAMDLSYVSASLD